MFKSLIKLLLKKAGYKIIKVPKQHVKPSFADNAVSIEKERFIHDISKDPLNAHLHLQYALNASKRGNHFLAYAELKTALFLGAEGDMVEKYISTFIENLPDPRFFGHNVYRRNRVLASEIIARGGKSVVSILDVGGGQGQLAAFLPDNYKYCLVEPKVNGISGKNLPFPDLSFDYIVSCHVLEHIPKEKRSLFLDQLLSKAQKGVVLLNPFHVEGTCVEERLKLFIEITDARWAKEHLECAFPKLEDIKIYAMERGLDFCSKPDGTLTTGIAYVFLEYFARKASEVENLKKINWFFNKNFADVTPTENNYTAYLVYIGRTNAAEQGI
jgi:SAM-dependent methyltransferase